jgi:hypothetical protein
MYTSIDIFPSIGSFFLPTNPQKMQSTTQRRIVISKRVAIVRALVQRKQTTKFGSFFPDETKKKIIVPSLQREAEREVFAFSLRIKLGNLSVPKLQENTRTIFMMAKMMKEIANV